MLFPEEDAPALKAWIVKRIENTSDADSDVLADYVIALLKHDGDPDSVRKLCEEEIPDFLTEEPKAFLDDVFQAIDYRSYVPGAPLPPKQAPPAASQPSSFDFDHPGAPPNKSASRKRGFHDRDDFDVPDGRDMGNFPGRGRPQKQPRRGWRGGMGDMRQGGFPSMVGMLPMPQFDPDNPMEAIMQMQAMGLPFPGMPEFLQQSFQGGGNRGRRSEKCPDFERKGFCSRGSTCMYDHGNESVYFPPMGLGGDNYDPNDAVMAMSNSQHQMNPFGFSSDQGRGRGRRRGRGGKRGVARAPFSAEGPVNDRTKSTLVVENIPEESFSEDTVRGFYSQFGNIVEVTMQPYKHLAIVKYDTWASANAAYRSPKVVFDNRFVKVFWLKDDVDSVQPTATHNGFGSNGHGESEGAEPEPDIDMEEFQRRQEEAQKQHQERESRKVELEQKRQELEKQQQDLLAKHREESERLQAKLVEKTGGDANAAPTDLLKAKLAALEQEAKILGLDPDAAEDASVYTSSRGGYRGRGSFRGRGYVPRRRGGFRGHDGRHAAYAQYSLDNRPRKLAITGVDFTAPGKDEVLRHFLLNLGEFESVDTASSATHVSFQDRKSAEKLYYSLHGKELPGVEGKLELAWVNTPLPPVKLAKKEVDDDMHDEGEIEENRDDAQFSKREERQVNMDYEVADDEGWGDIE